MKNHYDYVAKTMEHLSGVDGIVEERMRELLREVSNGDGESAHLIDCVSRANELSKLLLSIGETRRLLSDFIKHNLV
jgi:hypothetical protein